ncbi:protein NDRG3 [Lepeophtheirus salmonis]|uniref:protein NDRG3 n=1 Tax=Lepeophtheirus salmonis TaxID=72036 RepID=UPI003AF3CCDE
MEDVELRNVSSNTPLTRSLLAKPGDYEERKIETDKGSVLVALKGDPSQPALVTYHDLGLNYVSNFQAFFNYPDMAELLRKFYIVHINAPGQEEGAEVYPDTFKYPSLEELAEQINEILNNLKIVKYIGLGVGLGGNILLRHAKDYPERIEGLMLISTVCTTAGWIEWGYQKWNISYMRSHGITQSVVDYLMWHHFGYNPAERPSDLTNVFKHYFENDAQPVNLAKLCEQYIWRTQINIDRDISLQNITNNNNNTTKEDKLIENKSLQVPTLNICGAYNPFIEETVTLNSKLSPDKSSWMKIQDCGMAIEEQPAKVSEAFRLFLQGLGFCLSIRKTSSVGVVS